MKMNIVYSSIFVITLTIFFIVGHVIFPYPKIPHNLDAISLKLEQFAAHKDEYDTVFIGPSTTYRSIVPSLFDRLMAERGWKTKSFNFGINGAEAADTDFYLRKIMDLEPANLKWLFIEYKDHTFDKLENASSARNIYWHTFRQTLLDFRLILEAERDWTYKFFAAYANFKSFLCRTFWIGRLANLWQDQVLNLDLDELERNEVPDAHLLAEQSGYYALDWQTGKIYQNRHQNFLEKLNIYYQNVEDLKQGIAASEHLKPYSLKVLEDMCQYVKKQDAEPLLYVSPIVGAKALTTINLHQQKDDYRLFAFNDPEAFPHLYQVDHRFDFLHLNDQGARETTRLLAAQFSQYLATQ